MAVARALLHVVVFLFSLHRDAGPPGVDRRCASSLVRFLSLLLLNGRADIPLLLFVSGIS